MGPRIALAVATVAGALIASPPAGAAIVSGGSPPDLTPQNHQNEPAVAVDASHPNFAVAGWNDFVDWAPCPQSDATQFGTCFDPSDSGVGLSAVAFSFNSGRSWIQPANSGWTAADCSPTTTCTAHAGTIHTLPWYYENRLVSSGDPAVAIGPVVRNGRFSWANGSRVYYANLVGAWPSGFAFPNPEFHGTTGLGVSRLDDPTPASVLNKASWRSPVVINQHAGQTASEDKEQVWADNAASSPFFGRVYICNAEFRSNGNHSALGGNAPQPLTVSVSPNGGDTWSTKQITPAGSTGHGATLWGLSGCTVRTDSRGVVYLFAEMFQNPTLVGLPTHGFHVMFKSYDGGRSWTKLQVIRQVTDPCFFVDPVEGRCVLDGFAGARTDVSAAPSVDIANGAPTGAGATDEIVDAWSDNDADLNANTTQLAWSLDGGSSWKGPATVSLPGDRPLYSAPAISPTGDRMYVVYEADTTPWLGADMNAARPYHGVFLSAPVGTKGAPGGWTALYNGSTDTSTGHNDVRGTYPGHDIYQERVGDYVYAAATSGYGLGVWTDARNATVCGPVQSYRAASLAAGQHALPAPWPLSGCPGTFGNTDIWSASTG
jgi:hypothetical protein